MATHVSTTAVLGPGGVGGFLAAALARAGERPVIVAREETVAVIDTRGITVRSVRLGDFVAHPPAVARLDAPVQTLIVATKATGLGAALERIAAAPTLVVPLLNGLDHMAVLRARFGDGAVAAGTIRIESDRVGPGEIVQTSPFLRVELAADNAQLRPELERLADRLRTAEIPVEIGSSEAQILWSKLARLSALACTTSASDEPIGVIRSDPEWRAALVACIAEVTAVGAADGARLDPAATLAELDDAHPELGSSMRRDIAAGREPELDAIAGAVLRAAKRHEIPCPTLTRLAARVAARAGIAPPVV